MAVCFLPENSQAAIRLIQEKFMRYEELKDDSFKRVKLSNVSQYYEYKYCIEKISMGKYEHSKNSIKIFKYILNFIINIFCVSKNKKLNVYYNNNNNEMYSKFWWNISF